MESSRIFIKGLPPSITEADFKKHFASGGREVTDARLFANRRIGYIGYKTPEDAQKAVKYFNKTFVRMSRIGVEVARPIGESNGGRIGGRAPTAPVVPKEDYQSPFDTPKTQVNEGKDSAEEDPKLKEYLEVMKPKSKKRTWENEEALASQKDEAADNDHPMAINDEAASDDEYEEVPRKAKRAKVEATPAEQPPTDGAPEDSAQSKPDGAEETPIDDAAAQGPVSDADWARSRTSRLLGLLDDDEEEEEPNQSKARPASSEPSDSDDVPPTRPAAIQPARVPEQPVQTSTPTEQPDASQPEVTSEATGVRASMRLFLRNLPYDVQDEALKSEFASYGNLEEVHVSRDRKTGTGKGFAYIQFSDADSAEQALNEKDGQYFQGRILHVLPATAKREDKLNEFELSKLPLKTQQQIKKRREAASTTFNWNALYMNTDTVVSNVASRLGLSKSEVLDPTSSDAAVKQAHAETHIIQETKTYFRSQGVDLDAFKRSQRGDTAILVKNIPYDCSKDELKRLFEEHGDLKRFIMPPSGTLAIIEFPNAVQAKAAFGTLAYRKIKGSVLFLEKAPKDLFTLKPTDAAGVDGAYGISKLSTADLRNADADMTVAETSGTATLFVRNLNFDTTSQQLTETFEPLDGFLTACVKTRTDPKKPGQILSMGFGFLEFSSSAQAQAALQAMDGYSLHGHKLQIRASHKGADAAEQRRKEDKAKRESSKKTKVVVKNLPFEATKKDVRSLLGAYGQLRSVRVPKKMDRGARGFAFADFTTPKEAANAIDALRDTHLLGRRLVLDYAEEEAEDAEAEIEKMQKRVGSQVNKVALQKLTSGGRKKFTTENDAEE
ncbi:hypothetical protein Q7P37_004122 [Cladosporium fusiforme]